MTVRKFPVFAPVVIAGIGELPDTITDRSVFVRIRRRATHEQVEPFRMRCHEPAGPPSTTSSPPGRSPMTTRPSSRPATTDHQLCSWSGCVSLAGSSQPSHTLNGRCAG